MYSTENYKLVIADPGLRPAVFSLLQQNNLPVDDIDENKILFAFMEKNNVVGTGGLEIFDRYALLRSISVKKELQRTGIGKLLVYTLEMTARQKSIAYLYLLTTTAKDFFSKEGYELVHRDMVPEEIKNTTEFSSVCPSSAIVMRKILL